MLSVIIQHSFSRDIVMELLQVSSWARKHAGKLIALPECEDSACARNIPRERYHCYLASSSEMESA